MAKNEFKSLGDDLANLVQIVTKYGNSYGHPLYKAVDIMDELAKLRKGVNETEVLEACSVHARTEIRDDGYKVHGTGSSYSRTGPRKETEEHPNYNEFMQLVMAYGAAKAAYATAKQSGKYDLRKEGRLKRQANAAFEKVADAACRRFPGGKDYAA